MNPRRIFTSLTYFLYTNTSTTYIYTLSLHDALPIYPHRKRAQVRTPHGDARRGRKIERPSRDVRPAIDHRHGRTSRDGRSEEHTSELQSRFDLVCRLLLEKKKKHSPYIAGKVYSCIT